MAKEKSFSGLTAEERRQDFKEKDEILGEKYERILPEVFYSDFLFHDMREWEFQPSIIMYEFGETEGERKWKRKAVRIEEITDYCDRNDVAVNPCGYYNNFPRKKLMRCVYAFVMDVDEVRPKTLEFLLSMIERGDIVRPTVITNSGSGIHFMYILDHALEVGQREKYLKNLELAEQIYFMLHSVVKEQYKGVQKHHLGQDYRVVGSLTKFGDVTSAWKTGGFWSVEALAAALGVDLTGIYEKKKVSSPQMQLYAKSIAQSLNLDLPDFDRPGEVYDFIRDHKDEAYKERQRVREEQEAKGGKQGKRTIGWYNKTYFKVLNQTVAGNRFNALRALAIIAYKCGISEERFVNDIEKLSGVWSEIRWENGDRFNEENVEAIVRMFRNGERYKKTSRRRLEELLGWEWTGGNVRRNGLPRDEHLEIARLRKLQKKRSQTLKNPDHRPPGKDTHEKLLIRKYLHDHPDAKKSEIKCATGISYPTIRKYFDEIRSEIKLT